MHDQAAFVSLMSIRLTTYISEKKSANAVVTAVTFARWADVGTLYETCDASGQTKEESRPVLWLTYKNIAGMLLRQVLLAESQRRSTFGIEVGDMCVS